MSIPVARLNHAVLYVRDATRAAEFYGRVFGFEVVVGAGHPEVSVDPVARVRHRP